MTDKNNHSRYILCTFSRGYLENVQTNFFFFKRVKNKAIPYLHVNSAFHAFESLPKYQNNNLLFYLKIRIRTEQLKKRGKEIQDSSSLQFLT